MIDLYGHRATIRRITRTLTAGEYLTTAADAATGVALRIEERRGTLRNGPQGNALEFDAIAFMPPQSPALRPARGDDSADELIQTTPATSAAYRVLHVLDPDGFQHHREVYLEALP